MLQDSTPISLVTRTYMSSFTDDEKKRRESALKNKDFYYGRQEQYLALLNEDMDPLTVNLTNPIISKRSSLLYNRPLVRIFNGPQASVKFLEELYTKIKIDTTLQKADLSAELTGTALVYVGIDDNGEIYLLTYDASHFSPVATGLDNQYLEALSLINISNSMFANGKDIQVKRVIESEIWTENYLYTYRDTIQTESQTNEFGFIPFVAFKGQEVCNQYLGHTPTINTRQLNQYLNQVLTNLGYMIKMQSATPIVLTGFTNGEAVSVHPGTAISLPTGSTAGALQLNPKIMETMELIKYLEDKAYQTASVPKISVIGDLGSSTSGIELLIKWAPLTSVFKEKAARFETYEFNLANMILKVMDMEPIVDLQVKYPEESLLPVDTSREQLDTDIKYGIRTPIDEVLKINPTLNETDAEAMVRSNLDFNKTFTTNGGLDVRTE